jgi:hypothetical protein
MDEPPSDAPQPVALPEVVQISDAAMERWNGLAPDEPLYLPITKQMLDKLMLSLRHSAFSSVELGNSLQALSFENRAAANEHFIKHQMFSRQALSGFNQFIDAVMQGAKRESGDG